jgi:hypothetical protein
VAPVVRKPWRGAWQIEIAVPTRPGTPAVIAAVVQQALAFGERMSPGRYRLVLTPRHEPAIAPAAGERLAGAAPRARVASAQTYVGVRS